MRRGCKHCGGTTIDDACVACGLKSTDPTYDELLEQSKKDVTQLAAMCNEVVLLRSLLSRTTNCVADCDCNESVDLWTEIQRVL